MVSQKSLSFLQLALHYIAQPLHKNQEEQIKKLAEEKIKLEKEKNTLEERVRSEELQEQSAKKQEEEDLKNKQSQLATLEEKMKTLEKEKLSVTTENTAKINALKSEIANLEKEAETNRLAPLRDYFISEAIKRIPKVVLNGHPIKRLPNNINVSILDIEASRSFFIWIPKASLAPPVPLALRNRLIRRM